VATQRIEREPRDAERLDDDTPAAADSVVLARAEHDLVGETGLGQQHAALYDAQSATRAPIDREGPARRQRDRACMRAHHPTNAFYECMHGGIGSKRFGTAVSRSQPLADKRKARTQWMQRLHVFAAMNRRHRRPLDTTHLRGFEAAARHLSFTLAADELGLTQSSISRQVQALEDALGKALFARKTRALALTAAGTKLARSVRGALGEIDRAVDEIRGQSVRRRVTVSTYASFASLWLVPKLTALARELPDVDIRIDATDELVDLEAADVDVALRLCRAEQAPREAVELMTAALTPALAPSLLERAGGRLEPSDLGRFTLLMLEDTTENAMDDTWERWFRLAGVPLPANAPRLVFNFVDQSMQAAVRGQGIVLARTTFLRDFVERGELVAPIALRMPSRFRYYMLTHPGRRGEPHVRAFCEWIIRQVT
jgi:LysR family transcriptional regulator, glycine cleavage system transcriptional activator